jgi:hypothetical protein
MNNDIRKEYVTRDTILRLLSDDEIARVSTAETAAGLADGDEYVDLDAPDRGVQRAPDRPVTPMGLGVTSSSCSQRTGTRTKPRPADRYAGRASARRLAVSVGSHGHRAARHALGER